MLGERLAFGRSGRKPTQGEVADSPRRSLARDLSGWGKAGWTFFVVVLPLLGVLIYLIARGDSMQQRKYDDAVAQQQATDEYIPWVAGPSGSVADELAKLGTLRDDGVITEEQFDNQKAKLLA